MNKIGSIKDNGGSSIYERLGGKEPINTIIDLFFKKLLKDKRVKHYFENCNIDKIKKSFKNFIIF